MMIDVIKCRDCKYCAHTLERPNEHKPCEICAEHYHCYLYRHHHCPLIDPDKDYCSHAILRHGKMMTFY